MTTDKPKAAPWPLTLHAESRAHALESGVLVDVTHPARLFGLGPDVAITAAVEYLVTTHFRGAAKQTALAAVLANAAMWLSRGDQVVRFTLPIGYKQGLEELRAELGLNDAGSTCLTIGIPQDWKPEQSLTNVTDDVTPEQG